MSGEEVEDLVETWDSPQSHRLTIWACFPVARCPCDTTSLWLRCFNTSECAVSGQEAGWGLGADMGGESCYPCHSSRSWATHGDWEHVWWHPTWRGGMHHLKTPVCRGRTCVSQCHLSNHLSDISLTVTDDPSREESLPVHAPHILIQPWGHVLCLRPLHSLGGARCQSTQRWKRLSICDAP